MSVLPTRAAAVSERGPRAEAGSPLDAARARLDEALLALRQVVDPEIPVRRAAEKLAEALRASYLALARRTDFQGYRAAVDAGAEAARATLAALQESAHADPAAERATGLVAAALGSFMSAIAAPLSASLQLPEETAEGPGPVFTPATIGVPAVISVAREALLPAVPLPPQPPAPPPVEVEPPPPPPVTDVAGLQALRAAAEARAAEMDAPSPEDDDDDGAAAPPAAAARAAPAEVDPGLPLAVQLPAMEESALLYERARDCLEELAALGNMRRPLGGEPWAAPRTEQRLLARVDAIAACGQDMVPRLVRELEDRPMPDPELTWALIFLSGSLSGDDAADQVARLVATVDLDAPDMLVFVTDALALAPSPALERPLRAWMEPGRPPALRAAAVLALARRRRLTSAEAALAAQVGEGAHIARAAGAGPVDPRVLLAATRAFGFCGAGPVDALGLDQLLRHPDPEVVRAAFVSAFQLRSRLGAQRALSHTLDGKGEVGDAALFLALSGETDAWEPLSAAARAGSPLALEALGWFGSMRAVELLLHALDKGGPAAASAATALYRLTGVALADDSKPEPPDPAEPPELGGSFAPPTRPAELTKKAEIWAAWWDPRRRQVDPARRHRFGHLWSPEDALWELEDGLSGADDRQLAHLELLARTRAEAPLDLEDFVTRQRQHIGELRAQAARAPGRPGEWPNHLTR